MAKEVIEIAHDRAFSTDDINSVNVDCIVETRDAAHIKELRQRLVAEGFVRNEAVNVSQRPAD